MNGSQFFCHPFQSIEQTIVYEKLEFDLERHVKHEKENFVGAMPLYVL